MIDLRREVAPRWSFRLPTAGGPDGVLRVRDGVVQRLLRVGDEPVVVRAAQLAPHRVLFGAQAERRDLAEEGIARMRFALGVDDDLRTFHERFRHDRLVGRALRAEPGLRVRRRPDPWEALAWAVTEQLIEYGRAVAIQRRIVRALGPRCPRTGLRAVPGPERLAAVAPARLCSWDLAESRALALRRAAREIAAGRIDPGGLDAPRRLRGIAGIGRWTVETLALEGQGRLDALPAGDLNLRKLVGRLTGPEPRRVADEEDVRELFAPYAPWAGLAARYALRAARAPGGYSPSPARNSFVSAASARAGRSSSPLARIHAP